MNPTTDLQFIDTLETHWTDVFPVAPGWYILLLLLFIAIFFIKRHISKKQNQQVLIATDALQQCIDDFKKHKNTSKYLQDVNSLLRQVAIAQHGRHSVAHLSGQAWVKFLNATHPRKFNSEQATLLSKGAYSKDSQGDIKKLHKNVQEWVKAQYKTQGRKS